MAAASLYDDVSLIPENVSRERPVGTPRMVETEELNKTVWEILIEMQRFHGKAKEEDQGAAAFVLDFAKAFERVSLPVVWAWATHFSFLRKILQVEGCVAEPLQTITALPGSKWSCLLLRIVLQDALSQVTTIYPPLKLMVFVDDITALVKEKNREVAEKAKKVMKKLKEVEQEGLKLSVTENGREGKNKMNASCGFLENELRRFSREGVTLAESVESLGVDLREKMRGGRSAR